MKSTQSQHFLLRLFLKSAVWLARLGINELMKVAIFLSFGGSRFYYHNDSSTYWKDSFILFPCFWFEISQVIILPSTIMQSSLLG